MSAPCLPRQKSCGGARRIADALAAKGFDRAEALACIDRLRAAGEIDFAAIRRELIERKLPQDADYAARRALLYRYGHGSSFDD